ncbi:TadE/TadG family type IV pilus assembly protein [Xenophilus arseniciresistens]|uniref:TadE/TadG family type IV pilus assembly protein n=1 Tax=Xenophilus arseniciresistens TaxID=1283306 RepID=A0AAE3NDC0_9BURK|nr:TadE/TadG family type IV pilus assembly protein [Xenophilus arseniciresistens]MDA7418167.1 TadE/TadG family type IV pilus assembly protein [Xenophilus arseniciresistens]
MTAVIATGSRGHGSSGRGVQRQRGIAAIELALTLLVLIPLLYGLVTFGFALYAQQALSRAVEDGVRALSLGASNAEAKLVVRESLARSMIAPAAYNANAQSRRSWVDSSFTFEPSAPDALDVTYRFRSDYMQLFPAVLPYSWIPNTLSSQAAVGLAP